MTVTPNPVAEATALQLAAVDLYRDIHKGIRAELFALTTTAGSVDPESEQDRLAIAAHVVDVQQVLESHAAHEDDFIDPILARHLPVLGEQITTDHHRLEGSFRLVVDQTTALQRARSADARLHAHRLHLDLAAFTAAYLFHQDLEERQVMPAIERLIGPEGCGELHGAIVGSIPPDQLARSLAFMLPAMNRFDRLEMLGGIRQAAPPEAFEATLGLASSVLRPEDAAALRRGLGLT